MPHKYLHCNTICTFGNGPLDKYTETFKCYINDQEYECTLLFWTLDYSVICIVDYSCLVVWSAYLKIRNFSLYKSHMLTAFYLSLSLYIYIYIYIIFISCICKF